MARIITDNTFNRYEYECDNGEVYAIRQRTAVAAVLGNDLAASDLPNCPVNIRPRYVDMTATEGGLGRFRYRAVVCDKTNPVLNGALHAVNFDNIDWYIYKSTGEFSFRARGLQYT